MDLQKKFLDLPYWQRLAIGLTVFALMFVLTWYLRCQESKREATVMDVCWVNSQAVYDDDACNNPEPFSWPGYPKKVSYRAQSEYFESFKAAEDYWESRIGQNLIDLNPVHATDFDILVGKGSATDSGGQATSHSRLSDGTIICQIELRQASLITLVKDQFAHELGHCLFGLAHDRGRSIMSPEVGSKEFIQWAITDADRKAIDEVLSR